MKGRGWRESGSKEGEMVQEREDEEGEIVLHMSPNHLCCMTIIVIACCMRVCTQQNAPDTQLILNSYCL